MRAKLAATLLLAAACSLPAPLQAQTYLVMHLDPAMWDDPPTYLFVRTPGAAGHTRPDTRFKHVKLDGPITLLRVTPGHHLLLHFDFSKTTYGDSRTRHFKEPWEIRIHPKALHYVGPAAFAPPDRTQAYAEQILDLLCTSFPDKVSRMHEFRSLHYQQESVPLRYTCDPDGETPQAQQQPGVEEKQGH